MHMCILLHYASVAFLKYKKQEFVVNYLSSFSKLE